MGHEHAMGTTLTTLVAAFGLAFVGSGSAQEKDSQKKNSKPASPAPAPPQVEEYVFVEGALPYVPRNNTIVTKLPLDLRLTPNNVGVVTAPLIHEQLDRVVSDALVNVSNINVQTQNGVHDFFFIRGFDSLSSGLLLTDGAAESEASFYQLYNVHLVEVLKGPGGFLYGSNPLAGTVNLVRKQPVPSRFLDFSATAGSYDNYEGSFDWNQGRADGVASFRLNALMRDQGSHRKGKGGRTAAINPALALRFDETTRLNVNFEYLSADFTPDSGLPVIGDSVPPVDRDTNYQSPLDDSQQDIFRFQVDFEKELTSSITIRNKFYRRDLDLLSAGTIFVGFDPRSSSLFRTLLDLDDRQAFTGNQLEAVLTFDTGGVRHSLLTGLELARLDDRFSLDVGLLPPVDPLDPVDVSRRDPLPVPGGFAGDSRSLVAAPYVIDQIQLGDRLDVLVGGRADNIDFEDPVSGRASNDTNFSPMIGVLAAPTPNVSVYANFSRSFAPPSPRVTGDLVPERGTQYELGVKKSFPSLRAHATLAVYQLERDNIPIPDDNGFTQQVGNQRARGFEMDFSAEPSPGSRAFVSYAFNDAELTKFSEGFLVPTNPPTFVVADRSGNRPAFAPKHILNFWVSKDLSSSWGVGGGGRYVGEQFIAEDNGFAIGGVLTFDATVFYRIGNTRLRLNLKNLTDREYFLRGFGGTSVIPAPPLSLYVGVDVQL